jgi:uncharacterized protein
VHQATLNERWLAWADQLQQELDARFGDPEHGGWFSAHTRDANTIMRVKEDYDGAEPSPNSMGLYNLARLAVLRENDALRARAVQLANLFHASLMQSPQSVPVMVMGYEFLQGKGSHIVLAGDAQSPAYQALRRAVADTFHPHALMLHAPEGSPMKPLNGAPAAYVCTGHTCQAPVTTPEALLALL